MAEDKPSESAGLKVKQEQAILMMARGATIAQTAKLVGVSEQTIYNWKRDPQFLVRLRSETMLNLKDCRRELGALGGKAIETIADCLTCTNPHVRLKAATSILTSLGLDSLDVDQFLLLGLGIESKEESS